jgi:hypothetical protein
MTLKKISKLYSCILSATMLILLSLTGCGGAASVDLQSLYEANTTAAILENHSSIYEEFTYHENLDDEITFRTSYCYAEQSGGKAVYQAEGYDALDSQSDDNFSYCIVDNVEYFVNYAQEMILYPLTAQYIEDFKSNSFTLSINDAETLSSVRNDGSNVIITTVADASAIYDEDTLSSLASLHDDSISQVKFIYTADKQSLLLSSVQTYYIGESEEEYLFYEETVSYDDTVQPDVGFADTYINPSASRSVTVIEKTSSGDTSNVYSLPANVSPDFQCFKSYYGYDIFNDADGLDPFTGETADENGYYPNITLYAIPANEPANS